MNRSEALIRALWLADNHLIDRRISQHDYKTGILTRMETLRFPDERIARTSLEHFLSNPPSVLENCDELNNILFSFHQGLPRLHEDGHHPTRLIRIIDPDSLVCLHKELRLPHDEQFDWASIAIRDDHYSNNVLQDMSVDTHIHLGGTLPPLFYWIALMSGEVFINVVSEFAKRRRGFAGATDWQLAITEAMWQRMALAHWLQKVSDNQAFPYLHDKHATLWQLFIDDSFSKKPFAQVRDAIAAMNVKKRHAIPPKERLWPFWDPLHKNPPKTMRSHYALGERRFLTQLNQYLRSGLNHAEKQHIESRLLSYLRVKNAFHQLLIHNHGSDGLMRFVENFSRRGFYFRFTQQRQRQRRLYLHLEHSRMYAALEMQLRHAFSCNTAINRYNQATRRLEMRVSISENNQFLRLLHAWLSAIGRHIHPMAPMDDSDLEKARRQGIQASQFDLLFQSSQVGLLFHLNKSPENRAKGDTECVLAEKAKQSARKLGCVLADYPGLRNFIIGFDVAGDERNSVPRRFLSAYQHLQQLQQHYRTTRPHSPIQLGWTYHAGEDYDDLLTALRHIDEVDALLLGKDGGRIGHALALGEQPARFYQRRQGQSELELGTHLLDLVWAWGRLIEARQTDDIPWLEKRFAYYLLSSEQKQAHDYSISDALDKCYRAMNLPRYHYLGCAPGSYEFNTFSTNNNYSESRLLAILGLSNTKKMISVQTEPTWLDFCGRLQNLLRNHLAMRPVCIEANPTSNLIIGDYHHYYELPYMDLINARLALSLNTDDPGLFITSLPNEYSMMYQALANSKTMSHREILKWLTGRLYDGQQSSFLHNHVPIGQDNPAILKKTLAKVFKYYP